MDQYRDRATAADAGVALVPSGFAKRILGAAPLGDLVGTPVIGALAITLSGVASRLLGLLRDRLLAHAFGAGPVLDSYFAAYRIPDLLYNLLIAGALSAAFLPIVSRHLAAGAAGHTRAFRVANALLSLGTALVVGIALVLALFTPALVRAVVPGFDPERARLTTLLTRIMLLQPVLLGASSILSGLLLAFHRFAAFAAAPVLYNAGIIVGILVFVPVLGLSGLAWGVVFGAALHLLVHIPAVARLGFRLHPTWSLAPDSLRGVARLFLPRLVALLGNQVGGFIVTVVGSGLLAGSISAYLFADNLRSVPLGLIGIPLAVAAFPFLAAAAARQQAGRFVATLADTVRLTLFFTVPASVFFVLLRSQVVRVVLGTGSFSWEDTRATFSVLGILAVAVVAQSLIPLLARAFFSLHDTKVPMAISLAAIGLHVLGAVLLVPLLGLRGLAWAAVCAALVECLLLLTMLHVRLNGLQDRVLFSSLGRVALASLAGGFVIQGPGVLLSFLGMSLEDRAPVVRVAAQGLKGLIAAAVNMQTFWGVAAQLAGCVLGGGLVFLVVCRTLRSSELRLLGTAWRTWRSSSPDANGIPAA